MIVFDLKCSGGHVFEAWFGSSGDFEAQQARGLVACPLCGIDAVEKAVMAPAVAAKGNRSGGQNGNRSGGLSAGADEQALAKMLAAQRAMEAGSEWVGGRFAAEARAMHDAGEVRAVHGEATLAEARALVADGVPVMPLPFTPLAKSDA
jgi:hypothetical protein